ncbi:MAG TPA: glycoside hydrolase family 28 protein [Bryobacteraceae bacterium]|nr:glycoside hydrolase family 28 protein [Bryobacteraceae bacterium]
MARRAGAQTQAAKRRRYSIASEGAIADGQALNTRMIQAAIDRCSAAGGGTIVIPKGTFLTGALFFQKGVNLHLDADAILKGSTNIDDYPQVQTRWEGIEREWTSALLNFTDMEGVELTGEGTVDGSGDAWPRFRRPQGPRAPNGAPQTPPQRPPAAGPRRGRPRLICFQNCREVRVADLHFHNQAVWCLHVLYSEDVTVENLTIRANHDIPSSDGIDIDSCKNVRISRVDIDVNDDCITIKSGKDADGLRVNRPSDGVVVENSHFRYGHGGVAMGSETSGGIRNVEVRDCVADADNWAPVRFKSQPSRGGVVENITYRNFQLQNVRRAFEFNMEWRMVPPIAPPAKVLPVVRNVKCINVSGTAHDVGLIHGLKDSPIDGVTFERCEIKADRGLVIENARKVDIDGLKIEVKEGAPVTRRNA